MSIQHSVLGNTEYQHTPYRWVVANQAAREALTPTAADVGKLLLQESDQTTWVLVAHSPATWQGFATHTQGAKADTAVQPSRTISPGTGMQGGGDLSQNRTIGLDAGAIAALNLAATAVQPAAIAGFEAGSELNARDAANRDRSNHTGTQPLSTISDAGTAAANNTGDFATAAQGTKADSALQPGDTDASGFSFVLDEDSMASNSATKLATQQSIKAYVDSRVVGMLDYQGGYDASTNTPDLDAAPSGILQGYVYTVTAAGTFFSAAVEVGDFLIAEQDNPTLESHWTIVQANLTASMVLALLSGQALAVDTVNTGQGANKLHAMNQAVRTTDTPTFGNATADGHALNRATADGRYGQLGTANSWTGDQDVTGGISATNQITGNDGFVANGENTDFSQAGAILDFFSDHARLTAGSDGGNDRNLIIRANNSGTPNPNQIMVHYNGNVGFGVATPGARVDAAGNVVARGAVDGSGANQTRLANNGGSAQLWGMGPDASTNGTVSLISARSDTSNGIASLTATENGTDVIGTITATAGITPATGEDAITTVDGGTWTGSLVAGTSGTITMSSSFDTGEWQEINGRYTVTGYFEVSSVSSPTGELRLTGLPAPPRAGTELSTRAAVKISGSNFVDSAADLLEGFVAETLSYITIKGKSNGSHVDIADKVQAGTYIYVEVTYFG